MKLMTLCRRLQGHAVAGRCCLNLEGHSERDGVCKNRCQRKPSGSMIYQYSVLRLGNEWKVHIREEKNRELTTKDACMGRNMHH